MKKKLKYLHNSRYYLLHGIGVFAFSRDMRTFNSSGLPNFYLHPLPPIDIIARLEAIMSSPLANPTSTTPTLSYQEEIKLLESALSVLTHTKILPGAITLEPRQNDMLVATGFHGTQ